MKSQYTSSNKTGCGFCNFKLTKWQSVWSFCRGRASSSTILRMRPKRPRLEMPHKSQTLLCLRRPIKIDNLGYGWRQSPFALANWSTLQNMVYKFINYISHYLLWKESNGETRKHELNEKRGTFLELAPELICFITSWDFSL